MIFFCSLADCNFEVFSFSAYFSSSFLFYFYVLLLRMIFECLARFKVTFYTAIRGRIGKREVFRRSRRITLCTKSIYFGRKMFFQKRDVYAPMSDSLLWLLSKALDFWEMIILKSAPTFHLIYYAMFETLFFISLRQFFSLPRRRS